MSVEDEIERLQRGCDLLDKLRVLFYAMEDDGERERAWNYLTSLFSEFENSDEPYWQDIEDEVREP